MSNFVKLDDTYINLDQVQYVQYERNNSVHYLKFVFDHSEMLNSHDVHLIKDYDSEEEAHDVLRRIGLLS